MHPALPTNPLAARRRPRASWITRATLLTVALLAPGVAAGEPSPPGPVTLTEVVSQIDPGATRLSNLTELLRVRVEAEIGAIDWSKEGLRRRYKLSASVVRLETSRSGAGLQVSCTISAAVRDAERGTLLATIEGRARVEGASSAGTSAEQDALTGAVHSAIGAVPEAIRQTK